MSAPATSIGLVTEWFERSAKNAEAQKRHESALLWRDGLDHIKHLAAQRDVLLEFAEEVRRSGDTRLASMAIAVIASATGGKQ